MHSSSVTYIYLKRINLLILVLLCSCKTLQQNISMPFKIKDAIYYSWFVNEKERGTNFELTLTDLNGKIQFQAIVFRSMKIPLSATMKEDTVLLKGVVAGPESVLPDLSEPANGMNRLLFTRNGKPSSVNLEKIRRIETKYYKLNQ